MSCQGHFGSNMKWAVLRVVFHIYFLANGGAFAIEATFLDGHSHADECAPCDVLFSRLESTPGGGRAQYFEMQLRGESLGQCYIGQRRRKGTTYS